MASKTVIRPIGIHLRFLYFCVRPQVSRKLRPRKLRPQTRKFRPSGVSKTQMSRKLRPEKLRPSGCLENSDPKIKQIYAAWMPQADLFTVRRYSSKIQNAKSAEKRKAAHSEIMKIICREKKKQLAVLDTCNDHENYTQYSYRFFFSLSYKPSLYPQRVLSLEAISEVCCVMVSQSFERVK